MAETALKYTRENRDSFNPDLFEGDMILEPGQRLAAEFGLDLDGLNRGSVRNRQWPNGIVPYNIHSSLATQPKARKAIQAGMDLWSSQTCIQFVQRTDEKAYIEFFKGRGYGINPHALGFFHEQSRPDRDDYVTIHFENIKDGRAGNFRKYRTSSVNTLLTAYDYGSVMHYGARYFSKNRKPTIVPKKSGVFIGQRAGPSATDVLEMNSVYKCSGPSSFGKFRP
ncbi:zinc metalloproteinase nas-15-like [Pocillopora damicornis]|uniref:zinc metalloproteinase nas-15-like n=1 Tax=Pocillopora damicornis TaxID=46731 RepID=UPI000F556C8E|nr:zinc metalloproteinase nas-15-like [Pocillopora damicornis]